MLIKVNNSLKNFQHWLWPGNCLLCGAHLAKDADICGACKQALPRGRAACARCAANTALDATDAVCGECQTNPPAFVATRAAFQYAAPLDKLIQDLKYRERLELSRVLGNYLADYLVDKQESLPDVIVPVPLHASRLRERGYNQSLEIARFVAGRFNLPINITGVKRVRATLPQTELSREQRRKNLRGAFSAAQTFAGLEVAIVDDVMTSGYTADALARCLIQNGAEKVTVWVVARA